MNEALSYDDVLLVPRHSTVESRDEIDMSVSLDNDMRLALPIISSPMDTISEAEMGVVMCREGGMAVLHRYNSVREQEVMVTEVMRTLGREAVLAAAIGVSGGFLERSGVVVDAGAQVVCIDVAHGDHVLVERALKALKDKYGNTVHLMAGNVATLEGFENLVSWGADSIRVGIGGGSICSTRIQTGHGIPTLQSIIDCSATTSDVKIIADGGIKNAGDIVKSLAAGADFVMVGSLLAGTAETPGEVFTNPQGKKYKTYRGMASEAAQLSWRGVSSAPEGISTTIPFKGPASVLLKRIRGNIASGLSYSGASNITELQHNARFICQTAAGQFESSTHILGR